MSTAPDGEAEDDSETDPDAGVSPDNFVLRLEPFERVLLELKDQLYEGSWERILRDLRARLEDRPYVYKLSQAIARDVAAIERMKAYETTHQVNLSDLARRNR